VNASPLRSIRTLGEIPFPELPALDLLNLRHDRAAPDPDYAGFGHCRLAEVWLDGPDGGAPRPVRNVRILALHSADLGSARPDDVELEFVLDEIDPGYSVTALLSAFLDARLPAVLTDEQAVVLALCNPHRATLARPRAVAARSFHYALGDVESWLDPGGQIRLHAAAWRDAG